MSARRLDRALGTYWAPQQRWEWRRVDWCWLADRVGTVTLLVLGGVLIAAALGALIFGLMEGLHAWVVWRRGL